MNFPAPPPSSWPQSSGAPVADPPGRPTVFAQVLVRSLALSIVGGIVIGVLFVLVIWIGGESFGEYDESEGMLTVLVLAAMFGGIFGIALGVPAGLVLAAVAAFALVPYRGATTTRLAMRLAAALCVVAFFGALADGDERVWLVLGAAGVVGALVCSSWLVNWYVRRVEPARG